MATRIMVGRKYPRVYEVSMTSFNRFVASAIEEGRIIHALALAPGVEIAKLREILRNDGLAESQIEDIIANALADSGCRYVVEGGIRIVSSG